MLLAYDWPLCARSGRSCRRRNGMAGGQDHARGADISVWELRANERHCVSRETILLRRTCGRRRRRRPAPPRRPRQSLSACPFGLFPRPHKPHQLTDYQPLEQRAGAIASAGKRKISQRHQLKTDCPRSRPGGTARSSCRPDRGSSISAPRFQVLPAQDPRARPCFADHYGQCRYRRPAG